MQKVLIVVDMQVDFVNGSLGTAEAQAIVPAAAEKVRGHEGPVIFTRDTHGQDYLNTQEGKKLPVKWKRTIQRQSKKALNSLKKSYQSLNLRMFP